MCWISNLKDYTTFTDLIASHWDKWTEKVKRYLRIFGNDNIYLACQTYIFDTYIVIWHLYMRFLIQFQFIKEIFAWIHFTWSFHHLPRRWRDMIFWLIFPDYNILICIYESFYKFKLRISIHKQRTREKSKEASESRQQQDIEDKYILPINFILPPNLLSHVANPKFIAFALAIDLKCFQISLTLFQL